MVSAPWAAALAAHSASVLCGSHKSEGRSLFSLLTFARSLLQDAPVLVAVAFLSPGLPREQPWQNYRFLSIAADAIVTCKQHALCDRVLPANFAKAPQNPAWPHTHPVPPRH